MVGPFSWGVLALGLAIVLGLVTLFVVGVSVFRESRPRNRQP